MNEGQNLVSGGDKVWYQGDKINRPVSWTIAEIFS